MSYSSHNILFLSTITLSNLGLDHLHPFYSEFPRLRAQETLWLKEKLWDTIRKRESDKR